MNDFVVDHALPSQADDVCRVIRRSISKVCGSDYSHDPEAMAELLLPNTAVNLAKWIEDPQNYAVVATHQAAVIGFALIRGNEILLNYVAPEYIGQGVGHRLLTALESHAQSQGCRELHCTSTITAKRFYTAHGFQPFGKALYIGNIPGEFPLRKMLATRARRQPVTRSSEPL